MFGVEPKTGRYAYSIEYKQLRLISCREEVNTEDAIVIHLHAIERKNLIITLMNTCQFCWQNFSICHHISKCNLFLRMK
jgi:hypothetical protein